MGGKMRKSNVLVRGIGTTGTRYPAVVDGKTTQEYSIWSNMLYRCTEIGWVKCPSYFGCSVSETFKYYPNFYEWCQEQVGFGNIDENDRPWQLDKDILVQGNKIYGEDACIFVPSNINSMLLKSVIPKNNLPIGVYWHTRRLKFIAQCSDRKGLTEYLGCFDTPEEAFICYKAHKESVVKEAAGHYKNKIDVRLYQVLINYEVK